MRVAVTSAPLAIKATKDLRGRRSGGELKRHSDTEIARVRTAGEQAQAEAARANERAAELARETEVLRQKLAWRRLSQPQSQELVVALKGSRFSVIVTDIAGDAESVTFAEHSVRTLKAAGLDIRQRDVMVAGPPPIGVHVKRTPDDHGAILIAALERVGIPIAAISTSSNMEILVGSKPPAF